MAFEYNDNKKETGVDVTLEVPGGTTVPVTNVSFSEEAETSEVQFNNAYSQNIAVTGVTYSGSFETSGRDTELRNAVWGDGSGDVDSETALPRYLSSISITNGDGDTYTFSNVMITSSSKDMPADDRTSHSYDFSAEEMYVDGGF